MAAETVTGSWDCEDPYFVEDICEILIGKLNCDGTPADPANNTWLLSGVLDYETTDSYEDAGDSRITNASGGVCHNRTKKDTYTGTELTLRRCGAMHPSLFVAAGLGDPVYRELADGTKKITGFQKPDPSEECRCTACGADDCDPGLWMVTFASAWESCSTGKAQRARDEDGNCLYHVDLFPRITCFRPDGSTRISDDATSTQAGWTADLETNNNFGYGPVDPTTGETIWPACNDEMCRSHAAYLSPISPANVCGGCDITYDGTGDLPVLGSGPVAPAAPAGLKSSKKSSDEPDLTVAAKN